MAGRSGENGVGENMRERRDSTVSPWSTGLPADEGEPYGTIFGDVDAPRVSSDCFLSLFRGWTEDVLVARSLYAGMTINNIDLGLIYEWRSTFFRESQFPED